MSDPNHSCERLHSWQQTPTVASLQVCAKAHRGVAILKSPRAPATSSLVTPLPPAAQPDLNASLRMARPVS